MPVTPTPRTRRLQPQARANYRAEADALWTDLAIDALPAEAMEGLYAIADGERRGAALSRACGQWAKRWRVEADGIQYWARNFVTLYRKFGWRTINANPDLRQCYRIQRGWSDAEIAALAPARDRLAAWDARPFPRRLPLQGRTPDDDPLAPLSADPFVEDRATFLVRAACHWDARRAALNADAAYADAIAAPELRQHVEWLVRYQIHGESWGAIARRVGRSLATVTEGAKRVANAVGLTLRQSDPGGRPSARNH